MRLVLLCLLAFANLSSAQVPELLYLKFNEGNGAVTVDDALVGMPGISPTISNSSVAWGPGKLGGSGFKRSTTSTSGALVDLNAPVQAIGDWTFEVWLKPSTSSSVNIPFITDSSSGGFALASGTAFIDGDDLRFLGSFGEVVLDHARQLNTWVHIAIVNDTADGTMTPYVDGQPGLPWLPTGPTDLIGSTAGVFRIGSNWSGELDELRLWSRARTAAEIQASMNTELSAQALDLTISAIQSPIFLPHATQLLGASETVTCEIMNVGTSSLAAGTQVDLSFSVDGGSAVIETITLSQALAVGDRLVHSFAATADLSAPGPHVLTTTLIWAGDQNNNNDQLERIYGGSSGFLINSFPWTEDLESMPAGGSTRRLSTWIQELEPSSNASFPQDWGITNGSPSGISTTGYYLTGRGASFSPLYTAMRSSLIDLRGNASPRLRFRLHSNDSLPNSSGPTSFSIDLVSQPGDVLIPDVYGPVASIGPDWVSEQIDLSAHSGLVVQLRLRLVPPPQPIGAQNWIGHPVYLDDLLLTDHPVGLGQTPQPGLAVFDLNAAMNIGMNDVASGEAGPYYSSGLPGDLMQLSFEGAPNQPILLLSGPLNPQVASYPNIGQLDLGGLVDPISGIPRDLQVLFDGNQLGGFNGFFVTSSSGESSFAFVMPAFPPGVLTTLQAVLRDPMTGLFVIGNAIELSVN